ncbi:hypothetical protein ASF49_09495 [Methylobacterium sp. Leaf104]|uniref:hypothetical protein n=1 Tax=Methylobacterium TaxID=407 RepID=UPI0006FAC93E|nr:MULTISPECIES: hypothetical protein [Methylobacterium]KQP31667.1 hypothetical protein ASF49_09495 [Methylobacterium sp. Leaf104]MCI9880575.1 hypothetical protein [Methylobacterium goesingense]
MRIPTLILASTVGLALGGAAQAQTSVTGGGASTINGSGSSIGSSTSGSPATTGTAPGAGAVRNPNAAPLPSAGRAIAPGTTAPGPAHSGASSR